MASRRKVAPLNEEGGVAKITGMRVVQGNALYDIKYVVGTHAETGISAAGVLSKYDAARLTFRSASIPKAVRIVFPNVMVFRLTFNHAISKVVVLLIINRTSLYC